MGTDRVKYHKEFFMVTAAIMTELQKERNIYNNNFRVERRTIVNTFSLHVYAHSYTNLPFNSHIGIHKTVISMLFLQNRNNHENKEMFQ